MALRSYLISLSTRQAFELFTASLIVGGLSIFLTFGVPWIPTLVVLIYGSILLIALLKYHVQHSETTVNSPYFLGFIFFLFSLFMTFHSAVFNGGDFQLSLITRQLGSALLTTMVGLPIRQALLALSRSQADQDIFFRTLEEELRQGATEFRKAQSEFVDLIRELSTIRRELFVEEKKALTKYVGTLRNATEFLGGTVDQYPALVAAALDSCTKNLIALEEKLEEFSGSVNQLDGGKIQQSFESCMSLPNTVAGVDAALVQLRTSASAASKSIGEAPAELVVDLKETLGTTLRLMQESVSIASKSLTEAPATLIVGLRDTLDTTLRQLQESVSVASRSLTEAPAALLLGLRETLDTTLRQLQEAVSVASKSLTEAPAMLCVGIEDTVAQLNEIPSSARRQMSLVEADIKSISSILNQFIDILQSKVEAFN